MNHIAFMKHSLGFYPKLLTGEKTVESRWYSSKKAPFNKVFVGDIVFFKDSNTPVSLCAVVSEVLQFENLNPDAINIILKKYHNMIGISDVDNFFEFVKMKRYCVLIFLSDFKKIVPFNIDKTGFGQMCAWICVDDINSIRVLV